MSSWRGTGLALLAAAAIAVNGAAMPQPLLASSDAVACLALVAGALALVYPEVEMSQLYKFEIDGGRRTLLKDLSLQHLLRAARDVPTGVYFDLDPMHCPFSLRLRYFRPHEPNEVRERETTHPASRPFMDRLSQIPLDFPSERNTELLGQSIAVEVPYDTVDL